MGMRLQLSNHVIFKPIEIDREAVLAHEQTARLLIMRNSILQIYELLCIGFAAAEKVWKDFFRLCKEEF